MNKYALAIAAGTVLSAGVNTEKISDGVVPPNVKSPTKAELIEALSISAFRAGMGVRFYCEPGMLAEAKKQSGEDVTRDDVESEVIAEMNSYFDLRRTVEGYSSLLDMHGISTGLPKTDEGLNKILPNGADPDSMTIKFMSCQAPKL